MMHIGGATPENLPEESFNPRSQSRKELSTELCKGLVALTRRDPTVQEMMRNIRISGCDPIPVSPKVFVSMRRGHDVERWIALTKDGFRVVSQVRNRYSNAILSCPQIEPLNRFSLGRIDGEHALRIRMAGTTLESIRAEIENQSNKGLLPYLPDWARVLAERLSGNLVNDVLSNMGVDLRRVSKISREEMTNPLIEEFLKRVEFQSIAAPNQVTLTLPAGMSYYDFLNDAAAISRVFYGRNAINPDLLEKSPKVIFEKPHLIATNLNVVNSTNLSRKNMIEHGLLDLEPWDFAVAHTAQFLAGGYSPINGMEWVRAGEYRFYYRPHAGLIFHYDDGEGDPHPYVSASCKLPGGVEMAPRSFGKPTRRPS